MIRVFHCDDSAAYRRLVGELLAAEPDIEVVGGAGDPDEALEGVAREHPDVVLLDRLLRGDVPAEASAPEELVAALRRAAPGAALVVLSGLPGASAGLGADAEVAKAAGPAELARTIRAVRSEP